MCVVLKLNKTYFARSCQFDNMGQYIALNPIDICLPVVVDLMLQAIPKTEKWFFGSTFSMLKADSISRADNKPKTRRTGL